jgi:hypothetical protein
MISNIGRAQRQLSVSVHVVLHLLFYCKKCPVLLKYVALKKPLLRGALLCKNYKSTKTMKNSVNDALPKLAKGFHTFGYFNRVQCSARGPRQLLLVEPPAQRPEVHFVGGG